MLIYHHANNDKKVRLVFVPTNSRGDQYIELIFKYLEDRKEFPSKQLAIIRLQDAW